MRDVFDDLGAQFAEQPGPDAETTKLIRLRLFAAMQDAKVRSRATPSVGALVSALSERARFAVTFVVIAVLAVGLFVIPVPQLFHFGPGRIRSTVPVPKVQNAGSKISVAQMLAGRWSSLPPAPIAWRFGAVVVWTGKEMIVWGGTTLGNDSQVYGDGAAYIASTNTWKILAKSPLSPRAEASGVWTGTELVIFGGYRSMQGSKTPPVANDAAAYDPSTNTWRALPTAPIKPRAGAIALWSGKAVIIIGGQSAGKDYGDGAAFFPASGHWGYIAAPNAPGGHRLRWVAAVKAGGEVLAFSDWSLTKPEGANSYEMSGGSDLFAYNLTTRHWALLQKPSHAAPAPFQAIWTGRLLIARGDPANCGACSHPAWPEATDVLNSSTNSWTRIGADPIAMAEPVSTWTGQALLSFNTSSQIGSPGQAGYVGPGATSLYEPSRKHWSRLESAPFGCTNGPIPIWTGSRVLVYCPGPKVAGLVYTPAKA